MHKRLRKRGVPGSRLQERRDHRLKVLLCLKPGRSLWSRQGEEIALAAWLALRALSVGYGPNKGGTAELSFRPLGRKLFSYKKKE